MSKNLWSEAELILALNLYFKLEYEEMHTKNVDVLDLAKLTGRSVNSISMRLMNYIHCDPSYKIKGLDGGYGVCKPIWDKYYLNLSSLSASVEKIMPHFQIANLDIIKSEDIWKKVILVLSSHYKLEYSGSNPFLLSLDSDKFYVFVRNLTKAYSDRSPDVCRIQLPKTQRFEEIIQSAIPFIVLGYCHRYKTFAIWHSENVKPRLNGKGNVSLYSRFSKQVRVSQREKIRKFNLASGDPVTIINLNDIRLAFDTSGDGVPSKKHSDVESIFQNKYLRIILQKALLEPSEINAIKICIKFFESKQIEYNLIMIRDIIDKLKKEKI